MRWSIKLFRFAGTDVRLHVTFLLLLAFYGVVFYGAGGVPAMITGLTFILVLFFCVLLHEFGHVLTAQQYGIRTPDITLLPIGGLARLERMPDKPMQEFVVALAGPAVNVVIALALILMGAKFDWGLLSFGRPLSGDFLTDLLRINLMLVVFNMIPAFPMDGGRVLRALLATRLPYARATEIAATVGQAMAFVFGFIGFVSVPPNLILILIAFFVWMGASQEAALANLRDVSSGLPVSSAMVRQFRTLNETSRLNDAVEALLGTSQHEFPIVSGVGDVLGILTRQGLIRALKEKGVDALVIDVMERGIPSVQEHSPFDDAFRLMQECGCPALPVVDHSGRLVGLITPENVGEMVMIHAALGGSASPSWRRVMSAN